MISQDPESRIRIRMALLALLIISAALLFFTMLHVDGLKPRCSDIKMNISPALSRCFEREVAYKGVNDG